MKRRIILLVFAIGIVAVFLAAAVQVAPVKAQGTAPGSKPLVQTIRVEGPIEPAAALYIERAIEQAEENDAEALIILMDTPGGLMDSMRAIIQDIFASDVSVVVYVAPQGARAASAGAIILLASHVAAMSPGTNVGAAHPVGVGGEQPDEVMSKKLENDAAAYARSIARRRGRNVQWAEAAVRQSVSASETEAKQKNVIDIIAKDQQDLLRQLDGRRVRTDKGTVTLETSNAEAREINPSLRERFLHIIGNPNVAYILMLIAVYGIIFELQNPGGVFPGVIGGIALILALFSFAVLPVNLTGVLLIVLGVGLLIADVVFIPGTGILTVGGLISFVIGSLILFETQTPAYRVSLTLVITMSALTAAFFIFALGAGVRAQKNRIVTGSEGMIGELAEARTDINPRGKVFAEGTWWNAVTEDEPIKKGETVRIVGMDKLRVKVRKEA